MRPPTQPRRSFTAALLALSFAGTLYAQKQSDESKPPLDDQRREELAVQIFLDGQNFGPGRLDGKWGEFTVKAIERWNSAHADKKIATLDGKLDRAAKNKPYQQQELLITYTISDADLKQIGKVAGEPAQQANQKSLPYESARELIAEKFHSAADFISELNPSVKWDAIKTGSAVLVPNVAQPFELSAALEKKELSESDTSAKKASEKQTASSEKEHAKKTQAIQAIAVNVDMTKEILELRIDDKLVASYPITVGTGSNSPDPGDWKVDVVAWMPTFRYDKKMLKQGVRSDDAHMLPPGPNNPVGIVWIGLNADGIGIHGTNNPDDIGRNSSAGCIRLSNWDALSLAGQIETDVSVKIVRK